MAIYYDAASRQIRVHVSDRMQAMRDMHLETAHKGFLEFVGGSGERMVLQSTRPDELSISFNGVNTFTLHRE